MGQLCCFPFSRGEEKIGECGGSALPCASAGCAAAPGSLQLRKAGWRARGEKHAAEPDDAELVSLSKRLVENAVLKAVQQYLEETQNKTRQTDGSPVKTEEAASGTKNESDNESSK